MKSNKLTTMISLITLLSAIQSLWCSAHVMPADPSSTIKEFINDDNVINAGFGSANVKIINIFVNGALINKKNVDVKKLVDLIEAHNYKLNYNRDGVININIEMLVTITYSKILKGADKIVCYKKLFNERSFRGNYDEILKLQNGKLFYIQHCPSEIIDGVDDIYLSYK